MTFFSERQCKQETYVNVVKVVTVNFLWYSLTVSRQSLIQSNCISLSQIYHFTSFIIHQLGIEVQCVMHCIFSLHFYKSRSNLIVISLWCLVRGDTPVNSCSFCIPVLHWHIPCSGGLQPFSTRSLWNDNQNRVKLIFKYR